MQLTKLRAFLGHLALSLMVVGAVCALIFFVWYPAPYFEAKGAWNVLRVLLGVDVIVGPILTLILYRPNKPGLKLDMTVVALVQLTALTYGTTIIFRERPYFVVFAVDRFEVISRWEVDLAAAPDAALSDKPLVGPIPVVAVRPESQEAMQQLLNDVMFEGKPDIERRPEYWRPYADKKQHVIERLKPLHDLVEARPASRDRIVRVAQNRDRSLHRLGYVPLIGQDRDFAFVVDSETGALLDLIDVDPWIE